ncbi:hypothetical protein [Escherichia coli]|uniref:hypothetical protein n=1 Tax=Escherichia coli TaxID=562 RepID=UPI0026730D3B|nr:hypothetical protein [Escherichia coli]
MNKTPPLIAPARERWLFPLPQPDTVFSGESLLPPPVLSTPGRCPCCRRTVTHRFILEDSWPLQQMADTCRDTVVLLEKNLTRVMRLKKHPVPENADEKETHRTLQDAERSLAQPACRPGDWPCVMWKSHKSSQQMHSAKMKVNCCSRKARPFISVPSATPGTA